MKTVKDNNTKLVAKGVANLFNVPITTIYFLSEHHPDFPEPEQDRSRTYWYEEDVLEFSERYGKGKELMEYVANLRDDVKAQLGRSELFHPQPSPLAQDFIRTNKFFSKNQNNGSDLGMA